MPKVKYVEKTIWEKEGVKVKFKKDGKDVRGDASLPTNYISQKATKNSANVTFLKNKLHKQFPGYDFDVENAEKNKQRGNTLLGNVRDTFLEETE